MHALWCIQQNSSALLLRDSLPLREVGILFKDLKNILVMQFSYDGIINHFLQMASSTCHFHINFFTHSIINKVRIIV